MKTSCTSIGFPILLRIIYLSRTTSVLQEIELAACERGIGDTRALLEPLLVASGRDEGCWVNQQVEVHRCGTVGADNWGPPQLMKVMKRLMEENVAVLEQCC